MNAELERAYTRSSAVGILGSYLGAFVLLLFGITSLIQGARGWPPVLFIAVGAALIGCGFYAHSVVYRAANPKEDA